MREIRPSIFQLMRGAFPIEGMKLLSAGGVDSIDKPFRREGESWWTKEFLMKEEYKYGNVII